MEEARLKVFGVAQNKPRAKPKILAVERSAIKGYTHKPLPHMPTHLFRAFKLRD
jgi:hypothetical protein